MKRNKQFAGYRLSAIVMATSSILVGCGGERAAVSGDVDLSDGLAAIPSMSEALAANAESAVAVQSFGLRSSFGANAVSGTAPLLKELGTTVSVDTVFFDGAIAGMNVSDGAWAALGDSAKLTIARNYRGKNGSAGGQGACRMAQETGAVFDRMINNGNSACYMKKMPAATGSPADTFAQGAADKLVRVHVSNMSDGGGGGGDMYVNIKVHGTNSVTADVYKASLFFCAGTSGAPIADQGLEEFEINKITKLYTNTSKGGTHNAQSLAFLKQDGASIKIDNSKERSAAFSGTHEGQSFKQSVVLTPDNKVYAKSYNAGSWSGQTYVNKNFSVASFTGTSMDSLRFLAGAFKGAGENSSCSGCSTWSYQGGTEFQDTKYVSTTDSALYAELADMDIAGSFFAAPSLESATLSGLDCGATADASIEMDFSVAAVAAVQSECEGDRLFDSEDAWQMCEGGREKEFRTWGINID